MHITAIASSGDTQSSLTARMLSQVVFVCAVFAMVVAEEPMDLSRVERGALYIRLPARKLMRLPPLFV